MSALVFVDQAIKISFNIGIATTDTTDIILKYRKPIVDTNYFEEGEITEVLVDTAATGDVYVEVANDFLTPDGEWTFWSYVTTTDGNSFPGTPFTEWVRLEGDAITNKDFVKSYLGITVDTNDNKIEALIPLYEELYLKIRNAPWAQSYNETTEKLNNFYPPGSNVTIAEMIGYKLAQGSSYDTLTSESTMTYSWTSDGKTSSGFPNGIISQIKRYVRGL